MYHFGEKKYANKFAAQMNLSVDGQWAMLISRAYCVCACVLEFVCITQELDYFIVDAYHIYFDVAHFFLCW